MGWREGGRKPAFSQNQGLEHIKGKHCGRARVCILGEKLQIKWRELKKILVFFLLVFPFFSTFSLQEMNISSEG